MNRLKQYLLFLGTIALCATLHGQDSDKTTSLRFITFPRTLEPIKAQLLIEEGKFEEIVASSNSVSRPVEAPAMPEWIIGNVTTNASGEDNFNVFGKVKATEAEKQLVLILRRGEDFSAGVKMFVIDEEKTNFGLGKVMFLNATTTPIGGIVGGDKFTILPGSFEVVDPKAGESGRHYHTRLFYNKDGKAVGFHSSNWPYTTKSRAMVFIYSDPATGKIRRHVIRDTM